MENKLQKAAEAIEQGQARLLSEALSRERLILERLQNSGHEELHIRYQQQMDHLNQMLNEENNNSSFDENLRELKEGFDRTIEDIQRLPGFEDFLRLPSFRDIAEAAKINPIVYLIATDECGFALVLGVHEEDAQRCGYNFTDDVCSIPLPNLTNGNINQLLGDPLNPNKAGFYLGSYNKFMQVCDDIIMGKGYPEQLQPAFEQWKSALEQTTEWLWNAAMVQIIKLFPEGSQITLIPVGKLGLLPFHAAWSKDL